MQKKSQNTKKNNNSIVYEYLTKKNVLLFAVGILVCYIISAYGTNGIINPFLLFEGYGNKEGIYAETDDANVQFDIKELNKYYNYLNINVIDIDKFQEELKVEFIKGEVNEIIKSEELIINKGINSIKLKGEFSNVVFKIKDKSKISIDKNAFLSQCPYKNVKNFFCVFGGLIIMLCFGVSAVVIKKRYVN